MFSEVLFIMMISLIINQSSALWLSLFLVPSSILLMMGWSDLSNFSGVILMLVVLVFIGGLLVLLVGVSSTAKQEQSVSWAQTFVLFLVPVSLVFLLLEAKTPSILSQLFFFSWMSWGLPSLYLICTLLIVSLLLMTWLATSFKGSLRGV